MPRQMFDGHDEYNASAVVKMNVKSIGYRLPSLAEVTDTSFDANAYWTEMACAAVQLLWRNRYYAIWNDQNVIRAKIDGLICWIDSVEMVIIYYYYYLWYVIQCRSFVELMILDAWQYFHNLNWLKQSILWRIHFGIERFRSSFTLSTKQPAPGVMRLAQNLWFRLHRPLMIVHLFFITLDIDFMNFSVINHFNAKNSPVQANCTLSNWYSWFFQAGFLSLHSIKRFLFGRLGEIHSVLCTRTCWR